MRADQVERIFAHPSMVPGKEPLPAWATEFRPHQVDAIARVVEAFDSHDIVILDAPTGSGKTLIGETVRRILSTRGLYLCSTRGLQDQFLEDFDYAKLLKGRANYATLDEPEKFHDRYLRLSCADCVSDGGEDAECTYCSNVDYCPYTVAKRTARAAELGVLNTAYFLYESNGFRNTFGKRRVKGGEYREPFIILDECDTIESTLMSYVEVVVSDRTRTELDLGMPDRKTVADAWPRWVEDDALPAVEAHLVKLRARRVRDLKTMRELRRFIQLKERLAELPAEMRSGDWVYTGYDQGHVIFKPVKIDQHAPSRLFDGADRWLMMSATVIEPQEMMQSLGMSDARWTAVHLDAVFPKENRPVYVAPIADMTRKNRDTAWPEMAKAVRAVLDMHPTERILVHAVSYNFAQYLFDMLIEHRHRLVTYSSGGEREDALRIYREQEAAVMLAPSMERGVDLANDDCRVCIVCKMPFADLSDKQVNARLYTSGGNYWYRVQTVRSLVQMTGRGVRHADDTCTTYILDEQFMSNVYRKSKNLLPQWWRDALKFNGESIGNLRATLARG